MSTTKYSNGIRVSDTEKIVLVPPIANGNTVGGIKAKEKTNELLEVAVDSTTGKAYVGTTATSTSTGLMSASDKEKLDGIEAGANNYTHPSTHDASMITQDASHRFVSDSEKSTWNAKASTDEATTSKAGLMSSTDKTKLDGIAEGANNYSLPTAGKDALGGVKTTSDVTSASGYTAAPIIDGVVYYKDTDTKALGSMTGTLGIAHGGTGASTAAEALTNLGLTATATELNYMGGVTSKVQTQLDSKASKDVATTSAAGLMSAGDKLKLDGIAEGANNYTHPSSHPATMITDDESHRFVTDTQISTWNAKASTAVATTSTNGLMSASDKTKLNGIAEGANNYSHPSSHPATMITEDSTHRFMTDTERSKLESMKTVEISETEPTSEEASLWINPTNDDTINVPEVNDGVINTVDTWSSQKINNEIELLKESLPSGGSGVSSWNDLTDKPFEVLEPEIDIRWDGEIGDKFALDMSPLGFSDTWFVKVSDEVLTKDKVIGASYTQSNGNGIELTEDDIDDTSYPGALNLAGGVVAIYSSDDTNSALGLPTGYLTNGIYFVYFNEGSDINYTDHLTIPAKISKIDPKFLPDGIGYDIPPAFDIKWDGNMDGHTVLDMSALGFASGLYFVKVSDQVFTTDEVLGCTMESVWYNGDSDVWTIEEDMIDTSAYPGAFVIYDYIVVLHSADELAAALGIPSGIYTNGIYFWLYTEDGYISRFTAPTAIHKIDEKYLPEISTDSVRYDTTQSLTTYQKEVARKNIDAISRAEVEAMIAEAIGGIIGGSY